MFTAIVVFIALLFFGTIIVISISTLTASKKMKEKAQESGAIDVLTASHIEGIGLAPNAKCDLYLFSDTLLIEASGRKFEILLSNIRAAAYKSEQEIIEKGKSVVGRAAIGTLLLPGLGTIVGGMTGIGKKQVKGQRNFYLIINYIDSKGELQGITFKNNLNILKLSKFCDEINKSIGQTDQEPIQL